tara:strand:+ start:75 stop:548 length:474 start_codon:yes stop_codon:yes gene_type:complete
MKKIAVISCGSKKKDYKCPATEMYSDGLLFNTMHSFVKSEYNDYVILSGKYGVLNPDEIIEPYGDVVFFVQKIFRDKALKEGRTIKAVPRKEQDNWARKVKDQLDWESYDKVDFFVNIYYWKALEPYFGHDSKKFIFHKFKRRLGPNIKMFKKKIKL